MPGTMDDSVANGRQADKMMGKPVKDLIKKAKGVFAPEVLRGAPSSSGCRAGAACLSSPTQRPAS
jgi:hypothetical protein